MNPTRAVPGADPGRHLPLTDLAFSILVALADEELHGYALIRSLRERTGREKLRTGTVYAALARLRDDGLVAEADVADDGDERRKYYEVTPLGLEVTRLEAERLEELLALARAKRLTPGTA